MTSFILVIFGATGDLAQNKLIPSLFSLYKEKLLPEDFFIVGFSRREYSNEEFHNYFQTETKDSKVGRFQKTPCYISRVVLKTHRVIKI